MTFGVLPSMTATQELVVPRSIPMTLPMVFSFSSGSAGPEAPAGLTIPEERRFSLKAARADPS
jgi:hypothetical protein